MNCWKTINLARDVGNQRILFLSLLTTLFAFIMIYLPLSIINENIPLNGNYSLLFFACLFFLIPIHYMYRVLPAYFSGQKVIVKTTLKWGFIPSFQVKYNHTTSRNRKIFFILIPTVFFTCLFIYFSLLFPEFMHYFSMMAALNIGLSVSDVIFLIILLKAPKKSVIEHSNDSFDILIHNGFK